MSLSRRLVVFIVTSLGHCVLLTHLDTLLGRNLLRERMKTEYESGFTSMTDSSVPCVTDPLVLERGHCTRIRHTQVDLKDVENVYRRTGSLQKDVTCSQTTYG